MYQTPNSAPALSFEAALEQLEAIVRDLEDGRIGLSEALGRYEQGVSLLRQCYGLLENAERKIELLCEIDAAGNAKTTPFDDQATFVTEENPGPKRRPPGPAAGRRHSSQPAQTDIDGADALF